MKIFDLGKFWLLVSIVPETKKKLQSNEKFCYGRMRHYLMLLKVKEKKDWMT